MGNLRVSSGTSSPDNNLFEESGNLGDEWKQAAVDVTVQMGMNVSVV